MTLDLGNTFLTALVACCSVIIFCLLCYVLFWTNMFINVLIKSIYLYRVFVNVS